MKHWREYYLAKHKRKHFGGLKILAILIKWWMCIELRNYHWWIKCWRFCPIIAIHQSLLLTNVSSYTIFDKIITDSPKSYIIALCNVCILSEILKLWFYAKFVDYAGNFCLLCGNFCLLCGNVPNAFATLTQLCSKSCWHNRLNPNA